VLITYENMILYVVAFFFFRIVLDETLEFSEFKNFGFTNTNTTNYTWDAGNTNTTNT
jgi:hypothetical protein